jgi:hypothetical protein
MVEAAVDHALVERDAKLSLGRKDWAQLVGVLVMLLVQTVYVTAEWGALRADIEANRRAIEVRTEDRYTSSQAAGDLGILSHRIDAVEDREDILTQLIRDNQATVRNLEHRLATISETLAGIRADTATLKEARKNETHQSHP